jgi:outer membrane lipoprotein-sorting protein
MSRTWLRWMPAVAVPVLLASAAVAVPVAANASVDLPAKTPSQVLALLAGEKVTALSGTLTQTSNLGLPSLPTSGVGSDASATSALELVTGSHTARVYLDGRTNLRVQVMDTLAERDLIRRGSDVWLYESKGRKVVHSTLPDRAAALPDGSAGTVLTPEQLAKKVLASVDSTTTVTVAADTRVAGRTAYELVLTPRAADTLVSSVSIAVDSATGLPLKVDVAARGQNAAAVSIGFSSLTLAKPDAALFSFTPPAGAKVVEKAPPAAGSVKKHPGALTQEPAARPIVIGTGWNAVVSIPAGADPSKLTSSPLYAKLTSPIAGGHLFHTALVNVFLTDDGRLFAGSVPAARLQAAAATGK